MLLMVAAVAIALAASPGDGISLQQPDPPLVVVEPAAPLPQAPDPGSPPPIRLGALAASLAGLAHWLQRKTRYVDRLEVTAPEGVRVFFVSGHGSEATGTFAEMMERLDLEVSGDLTVVEFDYRDVEPWDSHRKASQKATSEEIADGIAAWLRSMSLAGKDPIYLVGHSKGAVAIAELLARWDLRPEQAVSEVIGAALLDPPMADGELGALQSLGKGPLSPIPNDGGYVAHHCRIGVFDCQDTRNHLGRAGGVEVVVFRNPEAGVTNFRDVPEGLRVNDISDPEAAGWGVGAVKAAHSYPLRSPAVAACIADEMRRPGSCVWPIRKWLAGEG